MPYGESVVNTVSLVKIFALQECAYKEDLIFSRRRECVVPDKKLPVLEQCLCLAYSRCS